MSKEHLWPQWAHSLLDMTSPVRIVRSSKINRTTNETRHLSESKRPGSAAKSRVRLVCKKCNSEWMSSIESAAISILTPLITGENISINVLMKEVIAKWVTLKIFVIDMANKEAAISSQEMRTKFYETQNIPSGFQVWFAQCGLGIWHQAIYSETHTFADVNKDRPSRPNIRNTTLGIGNLIINAVFCTDPSLSINFNHGPQNIVPAVYPVGTTTLVWPPVRRISPDEALKIAQAFARMNIAPSLLWDDNL